ncbi:alpha/beta hydrolase [Kitasatospora sp. NPDC090091]|uniref:alpha/beta hydrolase n=1 Tax=Kitasatospora sp. NPDC090091 TaxID=3364081 RepID=UPI003804E140
MTRDFTVNRRTVTTSVLLGSAALLLGGTRASAGSRTGSPTAGATPGGTRASAGSRTGSPTAGATPGDTRGGAVLTLPAPTGRHPVGCWSAYLVDASRRDPWTPSIPVRELMLTVFYPARSVAGLTPDPQLPPEAAALFGQIAPRTPLQLPGAGVDWAATMSHSFPGAPVLPGRRAVLVFSPGGGDPRGLGTSLAEDLASHGAVVVLVDHPGDPAAVEFPAVTPFRGDVVRPTVLRGDPRDQPPLWRTLIDTRIADLRFVIDRLCHAADLPLPPGLADTLDLRRIALYGHSAGGSAVTEALRENRQVRAGINLEGYLDYPPAAPGGEAEPFPVVTEGVEKPLLLLGSQGFTRRHELDRSWSALTARSSRWAHRERIADANHWIFTDYAAMVPQLQAAGLLTAQEREALTGAVDPTVAIPRIRRIVRGFFARHLAVR